MPPMHDDPPLSLPHLTHARAALEAMTDTGRDHHHVASAERNTLALLAAEADNALAAGDTEHLVADAVEMVKAVDPVAPSAAPVVRGEPALERIGKFGAGQRPAIDQERQRAVRDRAVVGEAVDLCGHERFSGACR